MTPCDYGWSVSIIITFDSIFPGSNNGNVPSQEQSSRSDFINSAKTDIMRYIDIISSQVQGST